MGSAAGVVEVVASDINTYMKKCYKCKIEKNLDDFRKDKSRKDGVSNRCKECADEYHKIYFMGHQEKLSAYGSQYHKSYYDPSNKNHELRKYKLAKRISKDRNKEFSLTLEEYTDLSNKPCYYCSNLLGDKPIAGTGLDRLDNNLGYIPGNCVSCCMKCNQLKMDVYTPEETKAAVEVILKKRGLYKIIEAEFD